jgi:hypothetical protein
MHAEVKYYKILQSQKRKGGDKACIVLHIDKPKHCPLSLATLIN